MAQEYLKLDPGEEVILTRRLHPIYLVPVILSTAILIIFSMLASAWLITHPATLPKELPVPILHLVLSGIIVLSIIVLVLVFLIYLQNRIILTNQHYIQISQYGLFSRTFSKLDLKDIQDARGTRRGVLPTLLNYGEILIETAGEEENFYFKPVGDALNLAEFINDAQKDNA